MNYKKQFFSSLLLAALAGLATPGIFVVIADPFRVYHESFFEGLAYSNIQRYQHAGLINTYLKKDPRYDTIISGSSTAANFYPEDVKKHLLRGEALNLSMNGSVPIEQHVVTKHALSTGNIKLLLWDIHAQMFAQAPDYIAGSEIPLPEYLYDKNPLNDGPYIFNFDNVKTGIHLYKNNFDGFDTPLNRIGAWYEGAWITEQFVDFSTEEFTRDYVIPDAKKTLMNWNERKYKRRLKSIGPFIYSEEDFNYPSIDQNLLSLIMPLCGTDTDIELFFTPFSRILYARIGDAHAIHKDLFMRRYIMEKTQACSNIHVSAFDNEDWITEDSNNYMDPFHYIIDINHYILSSIASGRHRLTPDNIDKYEHDFIVKVHRFIEKVAAQNPQ